MVVCILKMSGAFINHTSPEFLNINILLVKQYQAVIYFRQSHPLACYSVMSTVIYFVLVSF